MATTSNIQRQEALQEFFQDVVNNKDDNAFTAKISNRKNKKKVDSHYNRILNKSGYFSEARVLDVRDRLRAKLEERKKHG
jgi:hypothetical protein